MSAAVFALAKFFGGALIVALALYGLLCFCLDFKNAPTEEDIRNARFRREW
jgi:hypothetical protein